MKHATWQSFDWPSTNRACDNYMLGTSRGGPSASATLCSKVQDKTDHHKLSPPWEGPYVVKRVLKPGTYKLATEDGIELTHACNIKNLRHFYA